MRPVAIYSALRLGLFAVCLLAALALGARGLLAVLVAAAVSLGLSYVILRRQRESVAKALLGRRAQRPGSFGQFLRADAAAEDAAAEAARSRDRPDGTADPQATDERDRSSRPR
jgi:mannitol-specific phosphotransferase system IIBC component